MTTPPIDLRSDTVTQPTDPMRAAMMAAPLGDDVLGDDPTVNALQDKIASLLGKEAALFVPSGTMANQLAIRAQTSPGDQIIAHALSHVYEHETGAAAALSGCSFALMHTPRGLFEPDDIDPLIRPHDHHYAQSRMLVVENTMNGGGGVVWQMDQLRAVTERARKRGLIRHLDGARLFNACVAGGYAPADAAQYFDTISVCFSKGLGAPVGSALIGNTETIDRARHFRKMFGGAMRQAGILAAAAIYALDNNIDRLAQDHAAARTIAQLVNDLPAFEIDLPAVQTNMFYASITDPSLAASSVVGALEREDVLILDTAPSQIRAVFHLGVDAAHTDVIARAFRTALA